MTRRMSQVAMSTAVALLLAACTGVRSTQAPTAGPSGAAGTPKPGDTAAPTAVVTGEIRYLLEAPEKPEDLDPLRAHLKDFEAKYPGTTVKVETVPLEQLRQTLQATLRGQNPPDVFSWGSGPAYAGALADAGVLKDLTALYDQYKWPIYEGAKKQVTFDGKIVGVPGEMEMVGIYYNKKIFSDLGIAEPQNLAELEAAAQKVKDGGLIPFAAADKEGWEASHWFSMALGSRVGSAGVADLLEGRTSWNSPDVIAALAIWDKWNKAGFLSGQPNAATGIGYDAGNALFYSGEAAMVPTGSWLANEILGEGVKFEVGYIPFPSETDKGLWSIGLGSGPYIAANSKNPDAAVAFVDWLVSPEHGRWVVENLLTIPPYPVDTTGLKVDPLFAQVLEDIGTLSGGDSDFGANVDVQSSVDFNEAMFDGLQELLTGGKTPEQLAADLQAGYEKGKS